MRTHALYATLTSSLFALTGCPGETDADDVRALAAAMCGRYSACGCEVEYNPEYDRAFCEAAHERSLLALEEQAAESPDAVFDAECLRKQTQCWQQTECGVRVDDPRPCEVDCVVFRLNLGPGEDCQLPPESSGFEAFVSTCRDGLTCQGGHGYAVCDDETPLVQGDACDRGGHRRCGPGLFCDYDGAGRCVALLDLEEGSACASGNSCAAGLTCAEETCRAPSGEGESCISTPCGSGLTCHPAQQTCVAPLSRGQTCSFPDAYNVPCISETYCGDEVCEPRKAVGSACDGWVDTRCVEGSSCRDGACTLIDRVCSSLPGPF